MKWSCVSCMLCIARVTVHDQASCRDLSRKAAVAELERLRRCGSAPLPNSEAQDIVMRTDSFRDAVTRIALVSVMIVTETTGLAVTVSRKGARTVCGKLSVRGDGC